MSNSDLYKINILDFFEQKTSFIRQKKIGNNIYFAKPGQKTGSIAVDPIKNYFFDHQSGVGGGIIKAFSLYSNSNLIDIKPSNEIIIDHKTEIEIIYKGPVKHHLLKQYFTEKRKIPEKFLSEVLQIDYIHNEKKYFAIGWINVNGGLNTQNVYIKRVIGINGISFIKKNKTVENINLFESFFDYLAHLTYSGDLETDTLVLNSTSFVNFNLDISQYNKINCFFDNDNAGDEATNIILTKYKNAIDKRFYSCKDYNEFICI